METISEIIPFAKEMLNQRPGRHMLKIYMLGSTLAVLGVIGGLVETVLLPFAEREETVEERLAVLILERRKEEEDEKEQVLKSHLTSVQLGDEEDLATELIEDKVKYLMPNRNRSSVNRLHS
ncbi:G0/G1 switch protein 2 [Notolabrus celidotus]|uniref:G0/G1 switch protein 2 n=1 Tax=Notolabrus celidotus TaxID=1203425 RepID=UPI00148FD21A|nr:G0/G1 switch protein 2 [Notolabrus celidotus]